MKVAAVVVTYNRKDLLKECLQALLTQTRPLDEIIVIDNASTDRTDKMVPKEFPQVTYVRLPENIGGAGGFHEGMKLAYEKGYDWIWVMDDDAIPESRALERLLVNLSSLHTAGIVASFVKSQSGVSPAFRLPKTFREGIKHGLHVPIPANYSNPFSVDLLPFVGVLISRGVITMVGLPRKSFFLYFDDTDFFLRTRANKFQICIIPDSVIDHQVGAKSRALELWRLAYFWRNYFACFRLNRRVFSVQVRLGVVLHLMSRFPRSLVGMTLRSPHRINDSLILLRAGLSGLLLRLGKLQHRRMEKRL